MAVYLFANHRMTLILLLSICPQMNLHVPQGPSAIAEALSLLLTSENVISEQAGQALIGLWQDSKLGAYLLLTSGQGGRPVLFNRADACQLLMGVPPLDSCNVTKAGLLSQRLLPDPPADRDPTGAPLYSGAQILCAALPEGFEYESVEDGVLIENGEMLFAREQELEAEEEDAKRMGAKWLGESPDGLVAALWDT
jgi:hypothetical protein